MEGEGDLAEIEAAKGSFDDVVMKRRWNLKKIPVYYCCEHFWFPVWLGGFVS